MRLTSGQKQKCCLNAVRFFYSILNYTQLKKNSMNSTLFSQPFISISKTWHCCCCCFYFQSDLRLYSYLLINIKIPHSIYRQTVYILWTSSSIGFTCFHLLVWLRCKWTNSWMENKEKRLKNQTDQKLCCYSLQEKKKKYSSSKNKLK